MAFNGERNQRYRRLSYSVVGAILGTHNPLVPGSNPDGPTNSLRVQPGDIGYRMYRLHR